MSLASHRSTPASDVSRKNTTGIEIDGDVKQNSAILESYGKAIQLSGVDRYEFEKALAKNDIPIVDTSFEEVFADAVKLKDL